MHSATWTKPEPSRKVAKEVGVGGFELFRHGTVKLDVVAREHPICAGLPTPIMENVTVLVTSASQPAFWWYESGKGRVFECVPGHSFHTFNNSAFRKLLLQGMNWAAGKL
jgi:hypothetical protein